MKLQKIQKLTVVFTLLFLTIHSLKISHLQTNSEATGQIKNQLEQSTSSFNGFLVYPSYGKSNKLTDYDVTSFNETQKEVDTFIRNKTAVGDSKLTKAQGDGQTFVYRYENKTENNSQVWVITVCACSEIEDETNNISSGPKNSDSSSTSNEENKNSGTQSAQTPKYVITGINYVQNTKLTDEQKTQMEEKLKKRIQKFQKLQNQFKRQFQNTFKALEFL